MVKSEPTLAGVFVCILIGLHVVGFFMRDALSWGFHALGFLPPYVFIVYGVLALSIVLVHSKRIVIADKIPAVARFNQGKSWAFLGAVIILFIVCAVLLRVKAPLLGDGFFLVKNFSEALRGVSPLLFRNEPLSSGFFFIAVKILNPSTYAGFLTSFLTAELLLAIGFVTCAFYTVKTLLPNNPHTWTVALIFLLSFPYVQLFFGYVEVYAVVLLMVAIYVLVAALFLKRKLSFGIVPTVFLAMVLSHYIAVLLFPSLIYLASVAVRSGETRRVLVGFTTAAFIFLALLISVNFEFSRFTATVPHSHFLSLFPATDPDNAYTEAYTLLSPHHAADLLNFIVLLCASSIFLIVLAWRRQKRMLMELSENRFLLIAVVPFILFFVAVKFDLGAAKDWDVLAPYCYTLALLGSITFLRTEGAERTTVFPLITAITLLNTSAFVLLNATTEPSICRYESLFDRRTMSNAAHYASTLHLALYYHQVKKPSDAIAAWERYIDVFPLDVRGYRNVINTLRRSDPENDDRIDQAYSRLITVAPRDSDAAVEYSRFCIDVGDRKRSSGSLSTAISYYQKAIQLDPTNAQVYNNLGSVHAQQGNLGRAIELFQKAIDLDSTYTDAFYNLAMAYNEKGKKKQSRELMQRAALLGSLQAKEYLKNNRK